MGAGTLFHVDTARRCLDAGAGFLTTPGLDLEIVNFALGARCGGLPGRLDAHRDHGRLEGRVPISSRSFRASPTAAPLTSALSRGPFSEVPLIASGGVNQTNAMDFIRAGAVALGIGRDLIHQDAIRRRERGWITELARRYTKMVADARSIQKEAGA